MTLVTRMAHLPHSVHYSSLILYRCLQLELAEMEEGDVLLGTVSILVLTSILMNNYRTMYSVFTSSVADTLWSLASPAYVQLAREFHVSVDKIASSFSTNILVVAAYTYVALIFTIIYPYTWSKLR